MVVVVVPRPLLATTGATRAMGGLVWLPWEPETCSCGLVGSRWKIPAALPPQPPSCSALKGVCPLLWGVAAAVATGRDRDSRKGCLVQGWPAPPVCTVGGTALCTLLTEVLMGGVKGFETPRLWKEKALRVLRKRTI